MQSNKPSNTVVLTRLNKEIKEFEENPLKGVSAGPYGDDVLSWMLTIEGPQGSPYEGGLFFATLKFPQNFPSKAPKMTFSTRVYHPSVDKDGSLCCCFNQVTDEWPPSLTVRLALELLLSYLVDPDPYCTKNMDIWQVKRDDPAKFNAIAKDWVKKFAT